jgi:hypothetical protein
METRNKQTYTAPQVIQHEAIVFETAVSSGCTEWAYILTPTGIKRVCSDEV